NVELSNQHPRPLDQARREEPSPLRVRGVGVVVEGDVLRDRELEHEPAPLPVFRDMTDAGIEHLPRRRVDALAPRDLDRSRGGATEPRDRIDELALPVAVDARDPDDLPRPDVEG